MFANLINTIAGLVLVYSVVLHPTWVEQRYFPLMGFAAVFLVLAVVARRGDPHPWFSWTNIALAIALAILSLFPLATLPYLTFWVSFWVGCTVPILALWALLYRRDLRKAAP
ncbi:MAG: hypothetical protein OZ923_11515 [Comamonadaceae bacterium]|nr:hypothetical protein [Burkholderiales bacterium]MEB2349223.1 hypothetical protein [Comamonadaceae bacterium]